jgi:hypothetical protein
VGEERSAQHERGGHRVADDALEVNLEAMGDDAGKKNGFRFTRAP